MPQKLALLGGKPVRTKPFTRWPIFDKTEEAGLLRTLRSGKWGRLQGNEVSQFENQFAADHGCKFGIAVVNGTVSLRIALLAAGIQAEDEVIVPPYTFFSTASAVVEANAIPVFADVDIDTFNISPKAIEAAITPRTKAIIPVHFAGQPADMRAIMAIAKKRKLIVLEDAAHAHAARFNNQPAGSIGDLASFSFQSSKNMTSGEGGIITTNNEALAEACRSIQSCGRVPGGLWYEHHVISGNYRLGEFQGVVLGCQLRRLEAQTIKRDRNGRYLASRLNAIPGIHPQKQTPCCSRHSYHLFMLRVDAAQFGATRNDVVEALQAEGIPCSRGYVVSLPDQPIFRNKAFGPYISNAAAKHNYGNSRVPNSDLLCEQTIWLEQNLFLGTRSDMDDIAEAFHKVFENRVALPGKDSQKGRKRP
jgi:dTDP-4-amino-4,6-dideoxygalactose transaminase